MRLLLFCVFLYLVGVIQAAPTTNTTDTTISDSVKAPSFTTRSLWSIISTCVLTLFACIYTAIHTNIPSPDDSRYYILWRRLGIMIMALMAPELMVVWAMRQYFSACQVTTQFKEAKYPHVGPEARKEEPVDAPTHEATLYRSPARDFRDIIRDFFLCRLLRFLAKGGLSVLVSLWHFLCAFVRRIKALACKLFSKKSESDSDSDSDSEDYPWTETHSFFVLMGGLMLYVDEKPHLTLRPDYILKLIREGHIDAPTLTEKQIQDKSKGNLISKGLVILQVAWFLMQLITRAIYHLEITQLEVGTLAFAILNFLTYAFWWNKPLNVQCSHPVYPRSDSRLEDHIDDVSEPDILAQFGHLAPILRPFLELMGSPDIPTSFKLQVPTFDGSVKLSLPDQAAVGNSGMILAYVFGGMHCMAWYFPFPTYQEQVLWHISAVAITCAPTIGLNVWRFGRLLTSGHTLVDHMDIQDRNRLVALTYIIIITLYITFRAILLVLMFTTLRNLPPDAYKAVSWTSLMPHL